jgi:hypothetical protein
MTTDDNSNDESDFDAEAFLDKLRDDPAFRDEVRDILGQTPSSSRRALLKGAGTALGAGALVGGAGTAAADPQGEVGTSSDPVDRVYVNRLTMSGSSRDIESAGTVNADTGNLGGLSMNGGDITSAGTVNADTGNLSGLSMAGDVDMGGNDITSAGTVSAGTVSATNAELGGLSMGGNIDLGGNTLQNVGTVAGTVNFEVDSFSITGEGGSTYYVPLYSAAGVE